MSATAPLLRVDKLVKRYNGTTVVNDLSLDIRPGECLGVIGPNGAGKTTTIRMCLGLVGPDAGEIQAFGMPIPRAVREAKKRIGFVTHFHSLDPDFSCAENLRVHGRQLRFPAHVLEQRIPALVEFAAV